MLSNTGGHRQVGSGANTITLRKRTDPTYGRDGTPTGHLNAGYALFIGRKLYQDLGSPARVQVDHVAPCIYTIGPGDQYSVTNVAQNGMPRLHIGEEVIEELGLDEGIYQGAIKDGVIWFITPMGDGDEGKG